MFYFSSYFLSVWVLYDRMWPWQLCPWDRCRLRPFWKRLFLPLKIMAVYLVIISRQLMIMPWHQRFSTIWWKSTLQIMCLNLRVVTMLHFFPNLKVYSSCYWRFLILNENVYMHTNPCIFYWCKENLTSNFYLQSHLATDLMNINNNAFFYLHHFIDNTSKPQYGSETFQSNTSWRMFL